MWNLGQTGMISKFESDPTRKPVSRTGRLTGLFGCLAVTYRADRVCSGFDQDRMSRGQTVLVVTGGTKAVEGVEGYREVLGIWDGGFDDYADGRTDSGTDVVTT